MHHEFCNVTVPACRNEAGYCDCNGNGLFEPDLNETGWDCHSADTLEWYEKQPGYNHKNVSVEYRFALYGVDCADYCPEVCQFVFYNESNCDAEYYSYELHANPFGYIRETASYKFYQHRVWGNQTPTWKAVHINNNGCKICLGNGGDDDECFDNAGCHMITRHQEPTTVKSKEMCLQKEHTHYQQHSTADTGYNTKLNNEGNGS